MRSPRAVPFVLEKDIQGQILIYLRLLGLRAERLNSGAAAMSSPGSKRRYVRFSFVGCPDVVALLGDGRTLWIEAKRPGGKLSAEQARFADDCRRRGVPYVCAASVEAVVDYLKSLGVGARR